MAANVLYLLCWLRRLLVPGTLGIARSRLVLALPCLRLCHLALALVLLILALALATTNVDRLGACLSRSSVEIENSRVLPLQALRLTLALLVPCQVPLSLALWYLGHLMTDICVKNVWPSGSPILYLSVAAMISLLMRTSLYGPHGQG